MHMQPPRPYKTTPVFDQDSLPSALRGTHSTKAGVWGIIRVLEGALRYVTVEPAGEEMLTPERCGLVLPEQLHSVEPLGAVRMQVEFYRERPALD
jgi:tellurite resistance-related uncharacterized protein